MQGKIGLEEHFAIDATLADSEQYATPEVWPSLRRDLQDIPDGRIARMDTYGIERMILSLNAPAVQAVPEKAKAIELARQANDALAERVAQRPDRFSALAAVPLQDPEAACEEVSRCVNELGFIGALANGFSQIEIEDSAYYYDLPQYWPFWKTLETLDVPFYLHPRDPLLSRSQIYEGHPWLLGSAWAFAVETSTHALRLMGSGLFDSCPNLRIVLGHMGEGIPYNLWRLDHRIGTAPRGIPAQRTMQEYFRENFYITTSGNFRTQTLIDAILEIGSDRILFSTDYPFEKIEDASLWFDQTSISEIDRKKIGRLNSQTLFKL